MILLRYHDRLRALNDRWHRQHCRACLLSYPSIAIDECRRATPFTRRPSTLLSTHHGKFLGLLGSPARLWPQISFRRNCRPYKRQMAYLLPTVCKSPLRRFHLLRYNEISRVTSRVPYGVHMPCHSAHAMHSMLSEPGIDCYVKSTVTTGRPN